MIVEILKPEERPYTYRQSQQISMQTGHIGHLRADMDSNGKGFFSSWDDFRKDLKTQEFKDELDNVINELREKDNILSNRTALSRYCYSHSEASYGKDSLGSEREYGVRVNTDKYAYLMRLNPNKGEYNLYCYCYRRDWLDGHLEKASGGIRFINSDYKDLFRIEDGGNIIVRGYDGEDHKYPCRYIDQYHVEIGSTNNLYHICEWAERMEQNGATYRAEKPMLPEKCYAADYDGKIVLVEYGERGWLPTEYSAVDRESGKVIADKLNAELGVTKAQAAAMVAGLMNGWSSLDSNPKRYDENGKLKKEKQNDRGDAR